MSAPVRRVMLIKNGKSDHVVHKVQVDLKEGSIKTRCQKIGRPMTLDPNNPGDAAILAAAQTCPHC
jgi:hypothetical protein